LPSAAGFSRSVDSLDATHAANDAGTPGTSDRELDEEPDDALELDWVAVPGLLDGDPPELDWVAVPGLLDGDPVEVDWIAVPGLLDGDPPELDWVAVPAVPDVDPEDGVLCCAGTPWPPVSGAVLPCGV
jgi:hypothetical protein